MFFHNRTDDFPLDADAFAVDDTQGVNAAFKTSFNIINDNVPDLPRLELVKVKGAVDGIFKRFVGGRHGCSTRISNTDSTGDRPGDFQPSFLTGFRGFGIGCRLFGILFVFFAIALGLFELVLQIHYFVDHGRDGINEGINLPRFGRKK